MPGGVNSPVRAFKNVDGKPIFFKSAKGPILIDEDENQYIDFKKIGSFPKRVGTNGCRDLFESD